MKKITLLNLAIITLLSSSLFAGPPDYKQPAPAPPPPLYGVGFYGGIDAGANVYQDRGGDRTFTDDDVNSRFFGDSLEVNPKNEVGFFGGLKLGYVFGTGVFRPTVEGDFFYNGFKGGGDFTLRDPAGVIIRSVSTDRTVNTGAFMVNFILRIAPEGGKFQPYVGGGVGGYYAESAGTDISTPNGTFSTGGGRSHTDLAWQVVAGSDYFFNPNFSAFIEYKYLNYTSSQLETNEDRDLGQHLVGAGVRFFFH
jgi:opacity protein-like surface antigen